MLKFTAEAQAKHDAIAAALAAVGATIFDVIIVGHALVVIDNSENDGFCDGLDVDEALRQHIQIDVDQARDEAETRWRPCAALLEAAA
jgi:hypothetical protein